MSTRRPPAPGLSRRGLLLATGAGVGAVALTTAGDSLSPLRRLGLLTVRQVDRGPLGVPINRLARQADVRPEDVTAAAYRLQVSGPTPFTLGLGALEALPTLTRRLPIACVEGWSVQATWRGPALLDLVRRAGGDESSHVVVRSLQRHGGFASSTVFGPQLSAAVLATHLNGQRLPMDHGFPLRLIAPDRAGVHQTKWIDRIEVG